MAEVISSSQQLQQEASVPPREFVPIKFPGQGGSSGSTVTVEKEKKKKREEDYDNNKKKNDNDYENNKRGGGGGGGGRGASTKRGRGEFETKKRSEDSHQDEDPRFRDGVKKFVKKGGVGRNTLVSSRPPLIVSQQLLIALLCYRESFDPESTLVRPDMRILIGSKNTKPTNLKHDDVVVIPEFFCAEDDWSIYNQLVHEMRLIQERGERESEWISWHEGAHLISKNPSSSPTFQLIQQKIADHFSISNASVGTRFNWYRDLKDWKPFHHDSAAFNPQRARNQNITVGVSFGATKELAFLHAKTNTKIYFPQTNGMVFSFGRDVNISWKHGVNYIDEDAQAQQERDYKERCDPDVTVGRISIILWGLCGVTVEEDGSPPMLSDNTRGNGHHVHHAKHQQQRDGYNHNRSRSRSRERERDARDDRFRGRERDRDRDRGDRRSYHGRDRAGGGYDR